MSVAAGVSDSAFAERDKLRGKIGQTKVKRYWAGRVPEWGGEAQEDTTFPKHEDGDRPYYPPKDDRRLRRLAETREENKEELRADHRRIRHAEIVSTASATAEEERDHESEEEGDEEAHEERRRKIRERQLLLPQEEEPIEDDDDEVEESEYETDDSEDEQMGMATVKPAVFIPKSQRDTIAERERQEEEERQLEELVKKRLEARKIQTRQIVVEEINKDNHIHKTFNEEEEDVDTDDELKETEYESWKNREMARINRGREERDHATRLKDKEEIEKTSEEERREWRCRRNSKRKWKYMQKYYHKGAFFQEGVDGVRSHGQSVGTSDDIYARDCSKPTGEDKMDKSILPKVMQVKHFGHGQNQVDTSC